jgi:hypothetical protein
VCNLVYTMITVEALQRGLRDRLGSWDITEYQMQLEAESQMVFRVQKDP